MNLNIPSKTSSKSKEILSNEDFIHEKFGAKI